MGGPVRTAVGADVDVMATMADVRREQYSHRQPLFWRPAIGAQDTRRSDLAGLVASDEAISLVSEEAGQLTGSLVATMVPAPPVYDPGGLTCLIDDFVVVPAPRWLTAGVALLRTCLAEAGRRGAVHAVVVTGHHDRAKRRALRVCGPEVASEWWVTPQLLPPGRFRVVR